MLDLFNLGSWIAATRLSVAFQEMQNFVPAVQTVHILGIAGLFACTTLMNLRVLGIVSRDRLVTSQYQRFMKPTWISLLVLVLSGLGLLIAEPVRSITTRPFQLKMLLLVAVVALTVSLQRYFARNAQRWDSAAALPAAARAVAAASFLLWCSIIVLGRWIAYV